MLLVQAADRDFNINRLERYLTICHASNVSPIIVLSKIDLIGEQERTSIVESIQARIHQVPVLVLSNESQEGYDAIKAMIQKGKTYCMLGSSGVGKSTLLNNLSGKKVMHTARMKGVGTITAESIKATLCESKWLVYFLNNVHDYDLDYSKYLAELLPHNFKARSEVSSEN